MFIKEFKKCSKCLLELPVKQFQKRYRNKDGLMGSCKSCCKSYKKEYNTKNQNLNKYDTLRCSNCKEYKPATEEFFHRNRSRFSGFQNHCKACKKFKTLHDLYKMNQHDYDAMLIKQDGKCSICFRDNPGKRTRFSIDHCHITGKVRGLLCHYCNVAIGLFNDKIEHLNSAIKYLERHK